MFDNQRYHTRGINAEIPPILTSFIWTLIDDLCKSSHDVDYLQVFNLWKDLDATEKPVQVIRHTQEVPEYEAIYNLYMSDAPIQAKIYVIDDRDGHATMLLADEY